MERRRLHFNENLFFGCFLCSTLGYFDSKLLKTKLQINVIKKMISGRTPGGSNKILGRLGNTNLPSASQQQLDLKDIDPTVWGSVTWKILHNLFRLYDDLLAKTTTGAAGAGGVASIAGVASVNLDRQDLLEVVAQLGEPHGLPCTTCTRNFKEYFESHPKPSENLSFSDWSFQHHNHVNKLLGKAGFVPLAAPALHAPPASTIRPTSQTQAMPEAIKVTINNVQKFYYSQPQSRQLKLMTNASHIRHCKKVQEIVNNRMQQWLVQRKAASSNNGVVAAAAIAARGGNNNKKVRPPAIKRKGGCGCRR